MEEVYRFSEVITSPRVIMGVKALFGPLTGRAICFGSRDAQRLTDEKHFQMAKAAAEKAASMPYLIAIAGGKRCPDSLNGRVLHVVKVSKIFGETKAFYRDPEEQKRLAQWPAATALLDVYEVLGYPHLVNDLGLPDRTILAGAMDGIIRPDEKFLELYKAMQRTRLKVVDLPPLANFYEPQKLWRVGTFLPTGIAAEEGRCLVRKVQRYERRADVRAAALLRNRCKNNGYLACEACGFSDETEGMFDVHHLVPLNYGIRHTTPQDLAVLCPTCHRWAHVKGVGENTPLPLDALRAARQS